MLVLLFFQEGRSQNLGLLSMPQVTAFLQASVAGTANKEQLSLSMSLGPKSEDVPSMAFIILGDSSVEFPSLAGKSDAVPGWPRTHHPPVLTSPELGFLPGTVMPSLSTVWSLCWENTSHRFCVAGELLSGPPGPIYPFYF